MDLCHHLSPDEAGFQEEVQVYGKTDMQQQISRIDENLWSLSRALAYYEAHQEHIDVGIERAPHIRRQLSTITAELRTIFAPLVGLSVDATLASRATLKPPLYTIVFKQELFLLKQAKRGAVSFILNMKLMLNYPENRNSHLPNYPTLFEKKQRQKYRCVKQKLLPKEKKKKKGVRQQNFD